MCKCLLLIPVALSFLTGCGTVHRLTDMMNESSDSIEANTCAVQRSTQVIRENARLIESSTNTLKENQHQLESMSKS